MGYQPQGQQAGDNTHARNLKVPGQYHFHVTGIDEEPMKRGGGLIKGAAFKVSLQVLAPTEHETKTLDIIFFNPDPGSDGKLDRRKILAFLVATDLITPDQVDDPPQVDLSKAVDKQIMGNMSLWKENLQFHYDEIYHLDDPEAAKWPKNEAMVEPYPEAYRHKEANYFRPTTQKPPAKEPVNLDDL